MKRPSITFLRHSLPPLVAGLLLFAAGWSANAGTATPTPPSQLVLSPLPVEVNFLKGSSPLPRSGRWTLTAPVSLELHREGWPGKTVRVEARDGVTALRLPAPRATLSVSVTDDEQAEVEFLTLPKKTKVVSSQGQARLEAGPHELLVNARGYLPKRLSVELKPGELKKVTVTLDPLPGFPYGFSLPSESASHPAPPLGAFPSSGSAWTPPPAAAPPAWTPPATSPLPRFTPIPPPPRVGTPNPQPMFTPIGN